MIRRGEYPMVSFEVTSPWGSRGWRARDRKRCGMRAAEGEQEVVEFYRHNHAMHAYRKRADGQWAFEVVHGSAALQPEPVGLGLPAAEIYQFIAPPLAEDGRVP